MQDAPDTRHSLLLRLGDPHDHRAWSEFQQIYEPLVYRLVRRRGLQDADAREVTQDVLLAVSRAIERWDPDPQRGSFRGWLFRIARNLMINFLARQQRLPRTPGDTDFHQLLVQQAAPDASATSDFDDEYRRQTFRWAAEQVRAEFQPRTWQAFWRTCVEGVGVAQVAAELQMSPGALYVARSRVMARIRRQVEALDED